MYRVIKYFTDLQDNNHPYQVGDIFPHEGKEVTEKRLLELSTSANRRGMPLIEKVEVEPVQIEPIKAETEEPVEDFMNPPEEPIEEEDNEKPKKRRGRPRNDAE